MICDISICYVTLFRLCFSTFILFIQNNPKEVAAFRFMPSLFLLFLFVQIIDKNVRNALQSKISNYYISLLFIDICYFTDQMIVKIT